MLYFVCSEFNITGKPIPEGVADKIVKNFIEPLSRVRAEYGRPIKISERSGYRPVWYEKEKGRSGGSQHCFLGMGAADITVDDFDKNKYKLIALLAKHTEFSRIAVYDSKKFIHCDYALTDERWVFNEDWSRNFQIKG